MYKVLAYFTDKQDNNHAYHTGDTYPREGMTADKARIGELSGKKNKRGVPLIEKVAEKVEETKKGKKNVK